MMGNRRAAEQATLRARLAFLDAEEAATKPHVCDGFDHSACANKVRKSGYWKLATEFINGLPIERSVWIEDRSTVDCKYDRKHVDPACAKAKCPRIEQ